LILENNFSGCRGDGENGDYLPPEKCFLKLIKNTSQHLKILKKTPKFMKIELFKNIMQVTHLFVAPGDLHYLF
jgi:hypothetical protein